MKRTKFAAMIASLGFAATAISAASLSVCAAGTSYTAGLTAATDNGNAVSKNTFSFDKYLVMEVGANVPNANFNFAIAKYDASKAEKVVITAASDDNLAVINGVTSQSSGTLGFKANDSANTGSNNAGVISFVQTDATVTEGATGASTDVVWNDATTANEKYAKKTITLDFSTVQFTEPGVYRYLITETGNNQGVTNDTGVTGAGHTYRTLDVYVNDYSDYYNKLEDKTGATAPTGKELYISGYALYDGKYDTAPTINGSETDNKSTGYTNSYTSHDLKFSKTVTGNQGSKDKYFAFTVNISNAVAGTVYDVSYAADNDDNTLDGNADAAIAANPNSATTCIDEAKTQPATLTVGADGTVSQVFYLQHGQSIVIRGLADGTSYTITEDPEDYNISAEASGNDKKTGDEGADGTDITLNDNSMSDTYIKDDAVIDFTNDRSGAIPTGILSTVAGSVGIAALGVAGVAGGAIYLKKKKSEEE